VLREGNKLFLAPKLTVLSKSLGGEYQVRLPNGETRFLSPSEFKQYKISDLNNTSEQLGKVMDKTIDDVLSRPKYKDVAKPTSKDQIGYINSLDNKTLIRDVEKEFRLRIEEIIKKAEEEKRRTAELLKNASDIDAQQGTVEGDSGTPSSEPTDADYIVQGKLKHYAVLFTSTTTESEDHSDPYKSAPHIKRSRTFLNNAKNFKNRGKLRTILVTAKNAKDLGLEGLVQMSYGKDLVSDANAIEDVNDVDNGFIGAVFVEQAKSKLYFVDQEGNRIKDASGKDVAVGTQVDLNRVIFQTMPTTSLNQYTKSKEIRYRKDQEVEAKAASIAWKEKRKEILEIVETDYSGKRRKFSVVSAPMKDVLKAIKISKRKKYWE
jgi:hypothetical protein